jgi:hypothetical protein
MEELAVSESDLKDMKLMRSFIFECLSPFKRYTLAMNVEAFQGELREKPSWIAYVLTWIFVTGEHRCRKIRNRHHFSSLSPCLSICLLLYLSLSHSFSLSHFSLISFLNFTLKGTISFFIYWIFAWGVYNGGDTLVAWGQVFGLACGNDIFVQIVKIIIILYLPATAMQPQLLRIR